MKANDDNSLCLEARTVPHGNEDSDHRNLSSECCKCSPSDVHVTVTAATVRSWHIVKIHVEVAFHQPEPADTKVYVIQPKEPRLRNELWLLLVARYGLINANSKWQYMSDHALVDISLQHVSSIPQPFIKIEDKMNVALLVIKIFDVSLHLDMTQSSDPLLLPLGKLLVLELLSVDPDESGSMNCGSFNLMTIPV